MQILTPSFHARKLFFTPLVVGLLCGLFACTTPRPPIPNLVVPDTWHHQTPPAPSQTQLAQWWRLFGDAQLSDLIEQALRDSPNLRLATAKIQEARARRGLAIAQQGLSLGLGLDAARKDSYHDPLHSGSTNYSASLDASWERNLGGAQSATIQAASATEQANTADLHAAQVSLAAEIATEYLNLYIARQRIVVAQQTLGTRQQTLQLTEWRNQAQLASQLEVHQARSNLAQLAATVPVLQRSAETARLNLALLLGITRQDLAKRLQEDQQQLSAADEMVKVLPADLLRQRPDIRAAEQRLIAQTYQVQAGEAARYPNLRLSGEIGLNALTPAGLLRADTLFSNLIASLTAPLFDSGRIQQNIAIQQALYTQTVEVYRNTLNTALADVERALNVWQLSQIRQQSLYTAADSARRAAELALLRYRAGQIDILTVLDSQRLQYTQDDLRLTGQSERLASFIQLYKALGGGWQSTTTLATTTP